MIVRGLNNIKDHLHSEHMKNRQEYYRRNPPRRKWKYLGGESYIDGGNMVGEHDEDYVFDALFDTPNK